MSDIHKNIVAGRRKGCRNYPLEFKQRLVVVSYEPGVSVSKLALENGINANLLFKGVNTRGWRKSRYLYHLKRICHYCFRLHLMPKPYLLINHH